MRTAVFILFALLGAATAQQADAKPSSRPVHEAFDYESITIVHYDLDVRITPASKGFFARGTIKVKNDSSAPISRIALQVSSSLSWATVRFSNETLNFSQKKIVSDVDHTGAMNEVRFDLPTPLSPNDSVELEIGYAGTISHDPMRLVRLGAPREKAMLTEWDRISPSFVGLRGVGFANWYPVTIPPGRMLDGPTVFDEIGKWKRRHAGSRMSLTLAIDNLELEPVTQKETLTVCSADILTDAEWSSGRRPPQLPGHYWLTFRFNMNAPIIVAAAYDVIEGEHFKVCSFKSTGEDLVRRFSSAIASAKPLTKVRDRIVGIVKLRPRRAYLVQLPDDVAPFESSGALFLPFSEEAARSINVLVTHPISHTVFYSQRPWIDEGVAHLAQAIQVEAKYGRAGALRFVSERQGALAIASPDEPSKAKQSLITAYDDLYYRTKALYVWWMLRDMVGEDALIRALNKYLPAEDKEPSYIQRLIEAESKRDLEWFFSDWVYRDKGLPEFKIENVYARQDLRGGYLVTVTIENSGFAGAEVPVKIRTRAGDTWLRVEVKGKSKGSARVTVPQPPIDAVVNDGSVPETDPNDNTFTVQQQSQ